MPDALSSSRLEPMPIERLGDRSPKRNDSVDWVTPIDRSRWFYCETLTPLYYTDVYSTLGRQHRLRYNQLTGIYSNELIGFLETVILRRTLDRLIARADLGLPEALRAALLRFRDDEARHAEQWRRLNRLSEPDWYASRDYRILGMSAPAAAVASLVADHPVLFPLVLWMQLAQEERSIEISRRIARAPAGEIEPRYVAVYRAHLQDEVRHVQIDWHLIEHLFARRTAAARRFNAWAFRRIVETLFLTPASASARIIRLLVEEFPELEPLKSRMLDELAALSRSDAYQAMMYSRATTPITFALFDRFPEFHRMQDRLRAYRPQPNGGLA